MASKLDKTKKALNKKSIDRKSEKATVFFNLDSLLTEREKVYRKGNEKSLTWNAVEQAAKKKMNRNNR